MQIAKQPCLNFATCLAQPRIETGKTPTFVHAALPTVSLGASVLDGEVLPPDESGLPVGEGRLLAIDEIPDPFVETACPASLILESSRMKNFSGSVSVVRGHAFTEAHDAMDRLLFLNKVCSRLQEEMQKDAVKRGATYSTSMTGSEVAKVVLQLAESLVDDPEFEGLYDLFQVGKIPDPYSPSGERLCIPNQRGWTVAKHGDDRRTVKHVEGLIHSSVIKVCRTVAAILSDGECKGTKLVATLDDEITLKVLEVRNLHLPKSTGTAVLSAGIPLFSRLYRALFPRDEIRVIDIKLEKKSPIYRALLVTQSFTAKRVNQAFADHSWSGLGEKKERTDAQKAGDQKARDNFLGSVRRALQGAASIVRREQARGGFPPGPQQTLLLCHSAAVEWLVSADGAAWLSENVPPELSIKPGDPYNKEDPEKWGSIVYWGGRGRGENLWQGHRICITLGDPLPNIGDMEVRWGDEVDPETGELFEPSVVATWYAQESVMQALERTRPGRKGLPTLLFHAGRYLPVGFELEGPSATELIFAEETRTDARCTITAMKIASALGDEKDAQGGSLTRGSVARIAAAANVDPSTARKYMRGDDLGGLKGLLSEGANSGICPLRALNWQIPELARLFAIASELLSGAILKGTSLPSSSTLLGILEANSYPHVPATRTLQRYQKDLKKRMEKGESLAWSGNRNARESWGAVLFGSMEFMGVRSKFQERAWRLHEGYSDDGHGEPS